MWPIDSAVEQKDEKTTREEKLAEECLTTEEIKQLRKKKKLNEEQDFDDRGSNLRPLNEIPLANALAPSGNPNSGVTYNFLDHDAFNSSSAESSRDEAEKILNDNCSLYYLLGCGGAHEHQGPPKNAQIDVNDLLEFLAKPENVGNRVDVVELCCGEGGVGKLCIRRRLRRGERFDIIIWFDLSN